jgi:glutathione S-transferase
MKLFYSPGACSIGIHVILEETGAPYETQRVNFAVQEQYGPEYKAINPKSKVPALMRDDGSMVTEFPAIASWLARKYPAAHLLPDDLEAQTRVLEAMDYVVATLHMQGFSRMFRPSNFGPSEADHDAVKARGRDIIDKGYMLIDAALAGKPFLVGDFSIADAALFYVEYWGAERMKLTLPENCARHYKAMLARPSVRKVFADEGLELPAA